jgi:hypothetical protein
MRALVCALVLAAPATAAALEPAVSAEVVLGVQDVPEAALIAVQPRLVLRLDRDAWLTPYARLGVVQTVLAFDRGGAGHAYEGALGASLDGCSEGGWCGSLRLGLGWQQASYEKIHEGYDGQLDFESDTVFLELQPQLVLGRFVLGLELRAHEELTTRSNSSGRWSERREEGALQYALGLSLGARF